MAILEYISNIFVSFKVIYIHTVHVTVYTYMVSQGVWHGAYSFYSHKWFKQAS